MLEKWGNAIGEKKDTIVVTDDNMDHDNVSYNNRYRVSNIRHMTMDFFANNDITTHNNEYTCTLINAFDLLTIY